MDTLILRLKIYAYYKITQKYVPSLVILLYTTFKVTKLNKAKCRLSLNKPATSRFTITPSYSYPDERQTCFALFSLLIF